MVFYCFYCIFALKTIMKTTTKLTTQNLDTFLTMYYEGKMDTEIALQCQVSRSTIANWRKKYNLKSQFDYSKISKINNKKFEELFYFD